MNPAKAAGNMAIQQALERGLLSPIDPVPWGPPELEWLAPFEPPSGAASKEVKKTIGPSPKGAKPAAATKEVKKTIGPSPKGAKPAAAANTEGSAEVEPTTESKAPGPEKLASTEVGKPPTTTTSIAPKAPAMKPPPAVLEARRLVQRAQQIQEYLPSADRSRTVCSGSNCDFVSGTKPRPGFEHVSADDVARQAGKVGHPPTEGGYLDPTRTGEAADVHAEAKHATAEPGVTKGVGRPMCPSCQGLHQRQAITTGKTETVGDPAMVREFKPNGDIVEWHHNGTVVVRGPAAASATPGPEQTERSFRRAQATPPTAEEILPASETFSAKTTPSGATAETPPSVGNTPVVTGEKAPPVNVEGPSTAAPEVVAEGAATSGVKGPAVGEGATPVQVGRPGLTLRRIGGVAGQFAVWMMVDYIVRSWGDIRERAKIAELMAANVEPRIKERLAALNDEAERLLIDNPYASVYANVTVNLRYEGIEDKYGDKKEGIHDVTFVDLKLSLKPEEDLKEGGDVTRLRSILTGSRHYETIRSAVIPLPLELPETADQRESRQTRFSAQKLAEAGFSARGYAELATFWSEAQTERFVQAFIEVSTGQQRDDAVKYLDELRKRPPGWRRAQASGLRAPLPGSAFERGDR